MARNQANTGSRSPKARRRATIAASATLAAMATMCSIRHASAAATSYTWDSSGTAGSLSTAVDGSGTWSPAIYTNWVNKTTPNDIVWPNNATLDTAVIGSGGTAGTITLDPSTPILANVAFASVNSGSYTMSGGTLSFGAASGGTITLASGVTATINSAFNNMGGLNLFGTGTLIDNFANYYGGGSTTNFLAGGVTLIVPGVDTTTQKYLYGQTRLGSGGGSATIVFNGTGGSTNLLKLYTGGGTIDFEGTNALNITGFSVGSDAGARTLTLTGSTAGVGSFSAAITNSTNATPGVVSLIKVGVSTWTLLGTNTYTGPTAVKNGTLAVSGSIANSNSVTIDSTAANSTLKLTAANALNAAGSLIVTTGSSFAALINLGTTASVTETVSSFTINGFSEPVGTYSASNEPSADPTLFSGSGSLSVVPEPASASIIFLSGAGLLAGRRRRLVISAGPHIPSPAAA